MNELKISNHINLRNCLAVFLVGWTVAVIASYLWSIKQLTGNAEEKALVEARTISRQYNLFMKWVKAEGGVYLKTGSDRPLPPAQGDSTQKPTTGEELYHLVNPYQRGWMGGDFGGNGLSSGHLRSRNVSRDPINPLNKADDWEEHALLSLSRLTVEEISELTETDGKKYLRLLAPYLVAVECYSCHEYKKYDIGEIRGGMSVTIPLEPYYQVIHPVEKKIIAWHLVIWAVFFLTISLLAVFLKKRGIIAVVETEKYRVLCESSPDIEFWLRDKNSLEYISPSCERFLGYSQKEFFENPNLFFDIIHPGDKERFVMHLANFHSPTHAEGEYRIIDKNGETRWLSHRCSPIIINNKFMGRRGTNKDVTEIKKFYEDAFQVVQTECLGKFASGAAHDFNNVLTSIGTFLQLLRDEIDASYLNPMLAACRLGKNFSANLMTLGNRQIVRLKTVNLNEVVRDVLETIRIFVAADAALIINLSPNELHLFADPSQLEQILINLCKNAKEAMPDSGEITIATAKIVLDEEYQGSVSKIPPNVYAVLSVSDTGRGLMADDLNKIFNPFYSTKGSKGGMGIGLSAVQRILKHHFGFIDIITGKGRGTTFKIYLPASEGKGADSTAGRPEEQLLQEGRRNKTILLVDDDTLIRQALSSHLMYEGYKVIIAGDGEEAMIKFHDFRDEIDLVILDLILPKANGRDVFDHIVKEKPDINVMFISGYSDAVFPGGDSLPGKYEILTKPLNMDIFASKIENLMIS